MAEEWKAAESSSARGAWGRRRVRGRVRGCWCCDACDNYCLLAKEWSYPLMFADSSVDVTLEGVLEVDSFARSPSKFVGF